MSKHLLHKRSNALVDGKPKLPTADIIEYGEIAINYAKGQETLTIKNANDEIISLPFSGGGGGGVSGDYVAKSGDTMTGQLNIENNINIGSGNTFTSTDTAGTVSNGTYAFAQGSNCTASGQYSHAEGSGTTASGNHSHAQGIGCIASGEDSHAEGGMTTASGDGSHAEGGGTIASAYYSHAEGVLTKAIGYHSHAEGDRTIANNLAEHASGSYNVSILGTNQSTTALTNDSQATLFSIGNGDNDGGVETRKNAVEVKWNGDAYFSGDTKFAKGITANTISATTIVGTVVGASESANKLSTARTISLAGDVLGSVSFDGASDVTITTDIVGDFATKTELTDGLSTKVNVVELVHDAVDSLHYTLMVDSVNKGEINIPKDQFLKSASYDDTTKELIFVFDTESGETTTKIDVSNLVDIYVAGNGLSLASNTFSIDEAIVATKTDVSGKVAKTGDTMTGQLNIENNISIGTGNTVTGLYAFVQGIKCVVNGDFSHAEGESTTASGDYSHAEGKGAKASGRQSHAEGWSTTASGYASHAEGSGTIANGLNSHAEGSSTTASGECSHAEGEGTQASGRCSHAEGYYAIASGRCSHAEGESTKASGDYSHAEGYFTTASGENSHAEGEYTVANNRAEHASGSYNVSISGTSQALTALTTDSQATLFSIGNGYNDYTVSPSVETRKNAFEVKWNGDAYFSGDTKFAKGVSASTISSPTIDAKQDILVSGTNIKTINGESLLGSTDIVIVADTSDKVAKSGDTMTGQLNIENNVSIGTGNTFTHTDSGGTFNGEFSFAQGENCVASSSNCHSEGYGTIASGGYSHAEGYQTKANGYSSHVEGIYTKTYGYGSHAEGNNTITNNYAEHASGNYNVSTKGTNPYDIPTDSQSTLFSIGNGDSDSNRKNAFEVKYNGDSYVNGDLTVSGSITQASDRRLKHDIRPLEDNVLDKVMELNPSRYIMNDSDEEEIGFIAQEMEEVFPEFVTTNVGSGMKSVKYSVICSVLCKAIQELKSEIDVLKANQK